MKKTYKMKGYMLHLIPTDKFKNITISLKLQNRLERETVTKRTLLSFMLTSGTKDHPTTKELSKYLESLYGLRYGTNVATKGQSHIINVNSVCINEDYLPYQEDLLVKQIDLLNDVFHHPFIEDHKFNELMFNMKKKELKDRILSSQDDKFYYSLEKLFDYFGKDQPLGIRTNGYIEDLDTIKNEELYQYFNECIKNDTKHVYVVGKIDESIIDVFDKHLSFEDHDHVYPTVTSIQKQEVNEYKEEQDVTQAKLNMGYTVDSNLTSSSHYAFTVFNMIFGASSQSKLFKIVREKHSLCYYISSSYDAFHSIMIITAGIEGKDYDKVKELVAIQLEDMKKGKFSEKDIDVAKLMLKNSLKKSKDDPISSIALMYNRDIIHKEESEEEYIDKLMAVTKQDIIDCCQNVFLHTIFLLKGRDD